MLLDTIHAGQKVIGDDDIRADLIEPFKASLSISEVIDRGKRKGIINRAFHEMKMRFFIINDYDL